jgi:hypothetical protein
VALLTFPFPVADGTVYPVNPPANTNVYQWSSTDQTWILLGKSTGVASGTYGDAITVPQITIDSTGRITFAQDVAIQLASTSQIGLVQLVDNTTSNDATKALTAAAGSDIQNQIGDTSQLNPFYPNLVTAVNAANATTGAIAGTYGNGFNVAQFTVSAQGRLTFAGNVPLALATTVSPGVVRVGTNLNITGPGILSVPNASTTVAGAVQLVNNTTTNDATKALTASAGSNLQQQIDIINTRNNLTFAGTVDGFTGAVSSVTSEGTAVGFVVGVQLPTPSAINDEYFVVVTVAGTFTPPNSPAYSTTAGDWLVSDGSQWVLFAFDLGSVTQVNTGAGLAGGPITTTGTISVIPATTAAIGGVIPDGSTITVNAGGLISTRQYVTQVATGAGLSGGPITNTGTVSVVPATTSALGGVIPDGTSISVSSSGIISTVSNGTVTSVGTGAGLTGGPITSSGTVSVVPATTTALGGVIPDGVTILVSPTGAISAPVQKFVYLDDIQEPY